MSNPKNYGRVQCVTCGTQININHELAALLDELFHVLQATHLQDDRNEIYADFADSLFALGYKYIPMPDES